MITYPWLNFNGGVTEVPAHGLWKAPAWCSANLIVCFVIPKAILQKNFSIPVHANLTTFNLSLYRRNMEEIFFPRAYI